MTKYFLIIPFIFTVTNIFSQQLENIKFEQKGEKIYLFYDLTKSQNNQTFTISLYYSVNGGKYEGPLKTITGDAGNGIHGGYGKKIEWDVLKDIPELDSDNLIFKITATVETSTSNNSESSNIKALTPADYDIFKTKALEKTASLTSYMETIIDKSIGDDIKIKSVDLAVKLFQDETKTVEVSAKGSTQSRLIAVRQYLNRLRVLPFSSVKISWYDVNFVSEFKQGSDGRYYAVVTIFQKFEGYKDNKLAYSDITQKQIEIVLENKERKMGDVIIKQWDVMLGNIAVIETK